MLHEMKDHTFQISEVHQRPKVLNSLCEKVSSININNTDIYSIVSHLYQLFFFRFTVTQETKKKNYIRWQPWKTPHERLC